MSPEFFINNRRRLREKVNTEVIIVAANEEMQKKADAAFPFAQDAHFYYLTGILEAGWKLIFIGDKPLLVAPSRSESQSLFDGSFSLEDARRVSGINEIITETEYKVLLKDWAVEHASVGTITDDPHKHYYTFMLNNGPIKNVQLLRRTFKQVDDIRPTLSALRAIKQPEEITQIRQAIRITVDAFKIIHAHRAHYANERHIAAKLYFDFISEGAESLAYESIVAAGKNACTLHYVQNTADIKKDELVLIDAGAQYGQYAADITRTYARDKAAVSPRFVELHTAVEQAHQKIIELIRPGLALADYNDQVDTIMKQALQSVGLYNDESDYRRYFPHAISHGLGLDVHESLGGYKKFKPGMVLTVEPGIYVPEEAIGVRIEDDILVTETGNENLSAALPTGL